MGGSGLGSLASLIPGIGPILGPALGVLGLIQGGNQSAESSNRVNQGIGAYAPAQAAQGALLNQAEANNPAATDANAVNMATNNTSHMLSSVLGQLNGQFTAGGGQPTGDTAFQFSANNAANNLTNPLNAWIANQVATEPQRQAQGFENVFSAPTGGMSQAYFQGAQAAQPGPGAYSSSLAQLSQMANGWGAPQSGLSGAQGVMNNMGSGGYGIGPAQMSTPGYMGGNGSVDMSGNSINGITIPGVTTAPTSGFTDSGFGS